MSSPFVPSCRRRSHSATSPSPSPAPLSSWRPAHKRAHSSHRDTPALPDSQRYHLDIWRTGKRLRRDISPTQATRSSTPASADSTASSSSSAPHTPLLPASSTDFLLFRSHPRYRGNPPTHNPRTSPSSAVSFLHDDTCESSKSELVRLRSAAFSELKRSVQENGEGFVKRMREFEDSRSKSTQHAQSRGIERHRRKRHSPSAPTTRPVGKNAVSDDDDVLIFSSALSSQVFHPKQRRSSSLGAMDDTGFQLHNTPDSSGRLSPISSIFHLGPSCPYASLVHSSTTNQSAKLPASFNTSFDFANPHHTSAFEPASSHPSSDSLASSANPSLPESYTEDVNCPSSSFMVSPPPSPRHLSTGVISTSASNTEKVIAALTLAMANGAGSLEDYEAVRALNVSSADESQVGELWH